MSIDLLFVLETAQGFTAAAIALLAAYRSLTIRKSLVTPVYRTRANWLAILMIILCASAIEGLFASSSIGNDINTVLFFIFLLALIVFIDSNVTVAKELDFFHRDVLHWQGVRIPMLVAIFVGSAIGLVASFSTVLPSSASGFGLIGYFILVGAVFSYSGAAMLMIARRSYDRTMKRFVKLLGIGILAYVLYLTSWIPLNAIYPSLGDVVSNFAGIGAAYYFYRAAMSLSSVGRIMKEVVASSS